MNTNKKIREGIVISNKMSKTVVVAVERRAMDPKFKKISRRIHKFKVHDERSECQVGDFVRIVETKPISKEKCWRVQSVIKKASGFEAEKMSAA